MCLRRSPLSWNLWFAFSGWRVWSLRYLAPERFQGRADIRSDLYALGLTLYELLALEPAYDEKERHKLVKQVTTTEPARLERRSGHSAVTPPGTTPPDASARQELRLRRLARTWRQASGTPSQDL